MDHKAPHHLYSLSVICFYNVNSCTSISTRHWNGMSLPLMGLDQLVLMLATIFWLRIEKDYLATNRQSMFKDRPELIPFVPCTTKHMSKLAPGKIEPLLTRISLLFFSYYNLFPRFGINIRVWKNALSTLKFWVSSCSYHIIFFKILAFFYMEN